MAEVKVPKLLHKMSVSAQKAWYKKNNMEMPKAESGKSAAQAKKDVGEINKKKAREAAIAKAAASKKNKDLVSSSERVRQMATRRRESGEGLGGGLETNRDIISYVRSGGTIKAGRLGGSVYEAVMKTKQINKQKLKNYVRGLGTKAVIAGKVPFDQTHSPLRAGRKVLKQEEVEHIDEVTKKEAEAVIGSPVKEKPKMTPGKQPAGYRYVRSLARAALKASMKKEEVEQTDEAVRIVDVERGLPRKSNVRVRPGSLSASDFRDRLAQAAKERRKITGEPGVKGFNKPIGFSPTKYMDTSYVRAIKKEEVNYIEEKLTAADPASKWISDFVASDNPKFAGKSKKERIQQALGAYYAAKRGKNEENEFLESKKMVKMEKEVEENEDEEEMEDDEEEMEDDEEETKMKKEEVESIEEGAKDWKKAFSSVSQKNLQKDVGKMRSKVGRLKYIGMKPAVDDTPKVTAKVTGRGTYSEAALDSVGREDKDIDNDGDSDKTDLYLSKRRKAIGNALRKKVAGKMEK